ncbi:uncharacterized protein N7446_006753 [Penicillium canescens]|uniref:Nudix hydrolase domain-containing protein n=1 Tax=Penicillium canescens TaxID=5083 RepID=A0AAD6IM50_PENCN|nr:uncharacterized protein N7446_006753 [Penicillium canescens]KAJ6052111.1 hypothetical protein N7460_002645 [Penicillium canescens]KAJ6062633.1 hypothetical protein N7446_006753 [Penicillium canescens]
MDPQVRVGVGVFVLNSHGKFVIGKRQGSVGAGTWALPGGHLEFGESFETCAEREVLEETGMKISDVRFLTAVNSVMGDENKHYVTIFMGARVHGSEEPKILEPEKCEAWEWISWDEMKAGVGEGWNLFMPLSELFKQRPEFWV